MNSTIDNVALVRGVYEALARADLDAFLDLIADDVIWSIGGTGPIAGEHRGRDDAVAVLLQIFEATGGTIAHELLDVLAHGDTAVAVYRQTADGRHGRYDSVDITRFHIVGGRIVEAWEHPFDGRAFDALV